MDLYGRMLHDVLFPAFEAARGRPTVGLMRYLDRTQWASRDELNAIQSGLLRRLIRHAYRHTAWYRQALDARGLSPQDVREVEDLAKLPLLDKDDARGSHEARTATAPPYAVIKKATSGSTGVPVIVAYNAESRHWRDATRWRGYGWAGYQVGMKALHYWGFGAVPPATVVGKAKQALDRALKRDVYVDCTPRGDEDLDRVVDTIRRERPQVIVAYAQGAATLARHVLRTGRRDWGAIPVLCGAERLWDADRDAIGRAFGPAFETYGSREVMLIGSECEAHDGMHASMETMIVELVVREPDGRIRAARPGESGELAITDLHNLAAPMIRYVIGDLAVARAPGRCACGRWLDRIGPIEGRVTETLRDGRGNAVNGLVFNVLIVSLADAAKRFQVVQHADGRISFRIVTMDGRDLPPAMRRLVDEFTAKYLPGVPVTVERVDHIEPGPAGKHRVVVVEQAA